MSRGHFPGRNRKQSSGDGGNLSWQSRTAKIGVGDLRSVLGFESDVPYQQAFGLHFFEITPIDGANTFSPAPDLA